MDWPRYAAGYDSDRLPPLLRSLCPATADDREASVSPEADSAGRDSRDAVMRAVRAKVATILRTDAANLPGDATLIELGVDSLLALERRARGDVETAVKLLHSQGYYGGRATVQMDSTTKPVTVRLHLTPGPRYVLGRASVRYEPVPMVPAAPKHGKRRAP